MNVEPGRARNVGFEVVAGPDAGRSVVLAPGRSVVGRAAGCRLQLADPAVEAHHALVTVSHDGCAVVVQLAGRTPLGIDGSPIACSPMPTAVHGSIEIGDTVVVRSDREPRRAHDPAAQACRVVLDRPDEAAAVERAVRLAVAAAPAGRPGAVAVVLGIGVVPHRLELVSRDGVPIEAADLPLDVQVVLDRAVVDAPTGVVADLERSDRDVVAIVADRRRPELVATASGVARSIMAQLALPSGAGAWVVSLLDHRWGRPLAIDPLASRAIVVADRAEVFRWIEAAAPGRSAPTSSTVVLLADAGSPAIAAATSMLEIGARWRARWTPDTARPTESYRVHLRGVRDGVSRPATGPAADAS